MGSSATVVWILEKVRQRGDRDCEQICVERFCDKGAVDRACAHRGAEREPSSPTAGGSRVAREVAGHEGWNLAVVLERPGIRAECHLHGATSSPAGGESSRSRA